MPTSRDDPRSASAARTRDVAGGILLLALGAAVAYTATGYSLGTLTRMGPGFVPAALGVILALLGLALVAIAFVPPRDGVAPGAGIGAPLPGIQQPSAGFEWRGWVCICLGVILFAVLAEFTGLVPATFACVFVCAMGDRENTPGQAALLAAGMTLAAVVIFWWGLGVLLPLWKWDFS